MNTDRRTIARTATSFALAAFLFLGSGLFVPVAKAGSFPGGNTKDGDESAVTRFVGGIRLLSVVLDAVLP